MKFGVGKKRIVIQKLTILFLVLVIVTPLDFAHSESWPMFLHDPQHTGNSTTLAPNTNFTLWSVPIIGGNGWSSPTVANGRVFINMGNVGVSEGGTLYSLYEKNGTEIWNKTIGKDGEECSTPAVADGKVYVVGNKLYCFYVNNGTEVWNKSVGPAPGTSSPTVSENRVFVYTGTLYCFWANNGTENWSKSVLGSGYSTPAVADGKVFVNGGEFYCLYANNGTEIWNITGGGMGNSPVVTNGRVFYNPGEIKCLYANNGTEIWSQPEGGVGYSSPAVANGKVIVANGSGIRCHYASNGTEVWGVPLTGSGYSTPAISGDGKVFVNAGSTTYCLNASNGAVIWSYPTGGLGYSSPAIANGRVFVNQDAVYCFGPPPPTADYVLIRDQPNGLGNNLCDPLNYTYYPVGHITTFYGAAYNYTASGDGYICDVPVTSNWNSTNVSIVDVSTPGNYSSITCNDTNPGTVTITLDDGEGHNVTTQVTVLEPTEDYIQIRNEPGGTGLDLCNPANYLSLPVGNITILYGVAYNNTAGYIGEVGSASTWISSESGIVNVSSPGNFSFVTCNSTSWGNVTINLESNFGKINTTEIEVLEPTLDSIVIRTAPNGGGSWVGNSAYVYGLYSTFYAAGYNDTAGWIGDVTAQWSCNDSNIGNVSFGPSNSTTFFAKNNGTCNVTAIFDSLTNTTGTLTVINYTVDYIVIMDSPGNLGAWVGEMTFGAGEEITFYSAAFNNSAPGDGYIGDFSVEWECNDESIGLVTTPGSSTSFTAQSQGGECYVTARYAPLISNDSGILTVLTPTVDYIIIRDASNGAGNVVRTRTYDVGGTDAFWAAGYNDTIDYVGDVAVFWESSDPNRGNVIEGPDSSTTFYASSEHGGTLTITATSADPTITPDSTDLITIRDPTLDFIIIRDAPNGGGEIVEDRIYVIGEQAEFYAAGYNFTANYIGEMEVLWYSDSTTIGKVSPANSNYTTFQAQFVGGMCRVTARYSPDLFNTTGDLTVVSPTIDYIQIWDENHNLLSTVTLYEGYKMVCYAAGCNFTSGYLDYMEVTWSLIDNIANLDPEFGIYTNITGTVVGSSTLVASYNSEISNTSILIVIPRISAPTGLVVTAVSGGGALNISWDAVIDENLSGYHIYRSLTFDGIYERINTDLILTETYIDDRMVNGRRYYYFVAAMDIHEIYSDPSERASGVPDIDTDGDNLLNYEDDDDDGDGLTDEEEFDLGTDPLLKDTDGDGYDDKEDYYPLDPDRWEQPGEGILFLLIIIFVLIVIMLILLFFILKRRKHEREPTEKTEEEELPPKSESEIEAEEIPPPEDENIPPPEDETPEDELPPPKDEEFPPPKDEISEDELPPLDDDFNEDVLPPPPDD